ncbi:MAG: hypothetical protein OK474_01880, partial [Thaumarchaeota archaeon]|nr:hypothetical protein [Nitrososphaerota archaeon]
MQHNPRVDPLSSEYEYRTLFSINPYITTNELRGALNGQNFKIASVMLLLAASTLIIAIAPAHVGAA